MKYCRYCGRQLFDEAVICPGCGCPTEAYQAYSSPQRNDLLQTLSQRLRINGILWIVIAVIQIIIGLCGAWLPLIVGVLNIISAVKDLEYSKTVLTNPTGIVGNFEALTGPIITLVYNFFIGGIIGAAGSVYYFLGLRSFVLENKAAFLAMEAPRGNWYPQ